MAFTKTATTTHTVFGNVQVWMGTVTADAAAGALTFGFDRLAGATVTPASVASTVWNAQVNKGTGGTSIAGTLAITGATSGDDFYVVVYGY